MSFQKNTLALAALAALCFSAQAQTLGALYDAAREYDAAFLAARAQADAAQHRVTQSQALRKPSVGLSSSLTQNLSNPPNKPPLRRWRASLPIRCEVSRRR